MKCLLNALYEFWAWLVLCFFTAPRTPFWRNMTVASKTSLQRSMRRKCFSLLLPLPSMALLIPFTENTKLNTRRKASGMNTVWLMTWWHRRSSQKEASSGPARTTMVTSSLTLLPRDMAHWAWWPVCSSALMAKRWKQRLLMEQSRAIIAFISRAKRHPPTPSVFCASFLLDDPQ